jgi:hypothetical protein
MRTRGFEFNVSASRSASMVGKDWATASKNQRVELVSEIFKKLEYYEYSYKGKKVNFQVAKRDVWQYLKDNGYFWSIAVTGRNDSSRFWSHSKNLDARDNLEMLVEEHNEAVDAATIDTNTVVASNNTANDDEDEETEETPATMYVIYGVAAIIVVLILSKLIGK